MSLDWRYASHQDTNILSRKTHQINRAHFKGNVAPSLSHESFVAHTIGLQ